MMGEWESVLFGSSSSTTAGSCFDLPNNNNLLGFRNSADFLSSLPPQHYYSMEDGSNFFTLPSVDQLEFPTGYLEDALLELCHPAAASKRRRCENSAQNFHDVATAAAAAASSGGLLCTRDEGQRLEMTMLSQPEILDYYIPSSSSSDLYNGSVSPVSSDYKKPASVVADDIRDQSGSCSNSALTSSDDQLPHHPSAWLKREIHVKEENDDNEEKEMKQRAITKGTCDRGGEERRRGIRRRKRDRVAYPFALVKPGGEEGEITINDINKRILMAPTRPVRHPVGKYACRPCVSSTTTAAVAGLSGKAVVALTRIYTQGGKGTVTIIRTKG
ncbi:Protein XRI1 [Linum grandiflorum]